MFDKKQPQVPFDTMALELASQFGFDLQKTKDAFKGQDTKLSELFQSANSAKKSLQNYGVATLFLAAATPFTAGTSALGAAYTGYKTYDDGYRKLKWVGEQVENELKKKTAEPATQPIVPEIL